MIVLPDPVTPYSQTRANPPCLVPMAAVRSNRPSPTRQEPRYDHTLGHDC